VKTLPSRNSFN